MPTKRYRLHVPMDDETRDAINRLADLMGSSAGRTAGKFLDDLRPQLIMLADLMEKARTDPEAALQRLDSFADGAVEHLAETRAELAETRQAERQRSARPAGSASSAKPRRFHIENLATGELLGDGLTWSEDQAEGALTFVREVHPEREWGLREVGE